MFATGSKERIVFPPFNLDLAAGRLLCGSRAFDLRPKAFGVLQYLAERAGKLVSKEELLQANWANVHVGDDVLKVAVAEIRKVLGDTPRSSRYIETAHRRGYRFVARIEEHSIPQLSQIPFSNSARSTDFDTHSPKSSNANTASHETDDCLTDSRAATRWLSQLENLGREPSRSASLCNVQSFMRLIAFDKRGFTDSELDILGRSLKRVIRSLANVKTSGARRRPLRLRKSTRSIVHYRTLSAENGEFLE